MSPSAYITVRTTKSGRRYVVRFRVGGRYSKLRHAGSFKTQKAARDRRDFVIAELAAGRDPIATLAALANTQPARTYREWGHAYQASRVDHAAGTAKNTNAHLQRLTRIFGDRDPHTLTVSDQIEAVAILAAELAPSSLSRYWATHRLLLDFAGVDPNPARHRSVKLPKILEAEVSPPTADQFLAIVDRVPAKWRLPLVTIEQTAMTIGEATTLTWADVDESASRFRLQRANVKAQIKARARWIQVPDWLMLLIADTCPREDRTPQRRVFQGLTADAAGNAMSRACIAAGITVFSPHDLRHRRLSLWHGQGVPAKQLAERAGHSKASITLDIYSHVMPLDEAPQDALVSALVRSR